MAYIDNKEILFSARIGSVSGYELTEADKQEIANIVLGSMPEEPTKDEQAREDIAVLAERADKIETEYKAADASLNERCTVASERITRLDGNIRTLSENLSAVIERVSGHSTNLSIYSKKITALETADLAPKSYVNEKVSEVAARIDGIGNFDNIEDYADRLSNAENTIGNYGAKLSYIEECVTDLADGKTSVPKAEDAKSANVLNNPTYTTIKVTEDDGSFIHNISGGSVYVVNVYSSGGSFYTSMLLSFPTGANGASAHSHSAVDLTEEPHVTSVTLVIESNGYGMLNAEAHDTGEAKTMKGFYLQFIKLCNFHKPTFD